MSQKQLPSARSTGSGSMSACADQEWKTCRWSRSRTVASSYAGSRALSGPACGVSVVAVTIASSSGPREAEVDLRTGRVGPARGDHLAAGVELDPLGPVHVGVAEERVLPAAEGVVGDRHRDRHVDADHADLDLELEAPGRAAVAGEDGRAVGVGVGV